MCERVTVLDAFYTIKRPTMMCLEEKKKRKKKKKKRGKAKQNKKISY